MNFSKVNPDRSAPAHYNYYLLLINIGLIVLPTLTCAIYPDHIVQWCSFSVSAFRLIYIEGKLNFMLLCDTVVGAKLIFDPDFSAAFNLLFLCYVQYFQLSWVKVFIQSLRYIINI